MKRLSAYLFIAIIAIVSCSKELNQPAANVEDGERLATVTATIDGLTKTTYTEDLVNNRGDFSWDAGDQIDVLYKDSGYKMKTLTTTGDGVFTGTVAGTEGGDVFHVAVYPHNIVKSIYSSSGKESIHLLLPSVIDGDGSNAIPMIAHKANADFAGTYDFKHIGSVIRFSISNIPLSARQFVISNSDVDLAGTYYTTYSPSDDLYIYTAGSTDDGDQRSITYNFVPNSDGTYTFYLPFGTNEKPWFNFTFTFKDKNGTAICSKTTTLSGLKDIYLAKNKMYRVKFDAYTCPDYPEKTITLSPSDLPTTASTVAPGSEISKGGVYFRAFRLHNNGNGDMEYLKDENYTDGSITGTEAKLFNTSDFGQISKIVIYRGSTTMYGPKVYVGTTSCPLTTKVSASASTSHAGGGYSSLTYNISSGNHYFTLINIDKYNSYTGSIEITYKSFK